MSKDLEVPWVRVNSTSHPGRCYYYNRISRKSTWERPPELGDLEIPTHAAAVKGGKRKEVADISTAKPLQNAWSKSEIASVDHQKTSAPNGKKISSVPAVTLKPTKATDQDRPSKPSMAGDSKGEVEEAMEVERWGDEEEVAMDIDVSQEDIAEINSVRNTVSSPSQLRIESFGIPADYTNDFSDKLYLVLDTNVLLSHLNFLEELKDFAIKGVGKPVLVVPWIVMQELDKHKSFSNGRLAGKARKAVRLLFSCFTSNHPRVRCQTMEETHTEVQNMAIENNDDRILHCCLLYQMKTQGHGGVVVLFSNDLNLCTKAMGNGVKACDRTTLFKELRSLCQALPAQKCVSKPAALSLKMQPVASQPPSHISTTVPMASSPMTPYYSPTTPRSALSQKPTGLLRMDSGLKQSKEVSDLLTESEAIVRDTLSIPLKQEMMNAFDHLWSTMVVVKPPWSLKDQLFLIEKHWIAVYGQVLPHHARGIASQMWHSVRNRPGVLTVEEALLFTGRAVALIQGFRSCTYCADNVQKAVSDLNFISKRLQALKNQSMATSQVTLQSPITPTAQQPPVALVSPMAQFPPSVSVVTPAGAIVEPALLSSPLPLFTIPSLTTSSLALKEKLTLAVQSPPTDPPRQLEWVLALVHDSIIYSRAMVHETLGPSQTNLDRGNVSQFVRQVGELLSKIVSSLQSLFVHGVNIPRMQEALVAFDDFLGQALLVHSPLTIDIFFDLTSIPQQRELLQTALRVYTGLLTELQTIDARFNQ